MYVLQYRIQYTSMMLKTSQSISISVSSSKHTQSSESSYNINLIKPIQAFLLVLPG